MITRIAVISGIVVMGYSMFLCSKVMKIVKLEKIKKAWNFLFALECFFLMGYMFYLFELFSANKRLVFGESLVAAILFFGSIFVFVVMKESLGLVEKLNSNLQQEEEFNKDLKEKKEMLESEEKNLEEAKAKLEKKNKELEESVEGFYLMKTKADEPKKNRKK
jgi:hypothetical protein